mmetsp:Transcript_80733/g.152620  ORF Transcript_80733/g.152620 Transcript_80733/m.152620 type:complete len:87 (-) Transcript_80733:866-1126(-)
MMRIKQVTALIQSALCNGHRVKACTSVMVLATKPSLGRDNIQTASTQAAPLMLRGSAGSQGEDANDRRAVATRRPSMAGGRSYHRI